MKSEREYRKGKFFAIRCDDCEWAIDRNRNQVSVIRMSLLRRRSERTIPLEKVAGMMIRLAETPPVNLAAIGNLLGDALKAAKSGEADAEQWLSRLPKGLSVRLDEESGAGWPKETELRLAVEGIEDERDLVALAYQIADAAGLGYGGVFFLPGTGFEVRLSSRPDRRLDPLSEPVDDEATRSAAAAAVARAELPPFDPHRFTSSYKVEDWAPGRLAAFRRPFSKAALVVFPFTLSLLAGPVLFFAETETGLNLNLTGKLVFTAVSLVIGIPALAALASMLPRAIVFDWSTRSLSIRKRFSTKSVPFNRIERLEAHARYYDSGSDGGGSSRSHLCELKAILRAEMGKGSEVLEILQTDREPRSDVPVRQIFPLTAELAKALGVEHRTEDYSFRKSKD